MSIDSSDSSFSLDLKHLSPVDVESRPAPVIYVNPEKPLTAFHIEEETGETLDWQLHLIEDLYKTEFYEQRHWNFIGTTAEGKDHYIVSVLEKPLIGVHKALKTTKKDYLAFSINEVDLQEFSSKKTIPEQIEDYLATTFEAIFYEVRDRKFSHHLKLIEEKHPQKRTTMKIAIMYCQKGQTTPREMFSNEKASKAFTTFLDIMGEKIQLNGWTDYRGNFGTEENIESYFTVWQGIKVMYHVATMMDADHHRRLIGNDIAVIFFQEDDVFHPENLDQMGTVPQIFAVVSPSSKNQYRLGFFNRVSVKPYGPELPKHNYFDKQNLKDFVLCKMYNGLIQTQYCQPMSRLFYLPRDEAISQLVKQFPRESKKEAKLREKQEFIERLKEREKVDYTKELIVEVIEARNLAVKDKVSPEPMLMVSVLEEESEKTKAVKVNGDSVFWGECLAINIVGLDLIYTDVKITCWDGNKSNSREFMGQVVLPLNEILKNHLDISKWYPFGVRECSDYVFGEVKLKFSLNLDKTRALSLRGKESPRGSKLKIPLSLGSSGSEKDKSRKGTKQKTVSIVDIPEEIGKAKTERKGSSSPRGNVNNKIVNEGFKKDNIINSRPNTNLEEKRRRNSTVKK